mmetsp:Transcript_33075/g.69613  ORF Transcript_33075/g.69613 Transcript_33075/m.69613 type:complete len:271 (-) Transcript_33075:28-840(-)
MRHAAKFKRLTVTAIDVIKPMIALLMLNIVVLSVWTAIDPLQRQTIVVTQDSFLRDVETFGVCSSDHQPIFLATLAVINLGSLLFALFQAYKARNISTELQESSYIFVAMILILLVSFIGIPVIIIARDNVSAFYFVMAGLIFVVCTSILLLIFMPKVIALRKKSSTSTRRETSVGSAGVMILSTPMDKAELEEEIQGLKRLLESKQTKRNLMYRKTLIESVHDIEDSSHSAVDDVSGSDSDHKEEGQSFRRASLESVPEDSEGHDNHNI